MLAQNPRWGFRRLELLPSSVRGERSRTYQSLHGPEEKGPSHFTLASTARGKSSLADQVVCHWEASILEGSVRQQRKIADARNSSI